MKQSKNYLISPLDKLKQEICLRYRFVQYMKLHKNFLLNRIEKNNVQLLFETLEDLKSETIR